MNPTTKIVACLLPIFFGAQLHADVLTFASNEFNLVGSGNITATFDFSTQIQNGNTLTDADVTSWSMSAVGQTIDSSDFSFFVAEFVIGPSLLPTSWTFVAEKQLLGGTLPETIVSHFGPTSFDGEFPNPNEYYFAVDDFAGGEPIGIGLGSGSNAGSLLPAGTWAAVPEPNAYWYLSVVSVGCIVWKKAARHLNVS